VILAKSDAIVLAVASAKRLQVRSAISVELTVSETLYGDKVGNSIVLFFNDPDLLAKDEAVRAMFALKKLATGGFKLVGKPVPTPEGEVESKEKVDVAKAYIELESNDEGDKRTRKLWNLLVRHISDGGYSAENAAVELLFIARDRSGTITLVRYDAVVEAEETAKGNLTKQAKADLQLARRGMVEGRIKDLRFKGIRRGKKKLEKRTAAGALLDLIKNFPLAFDKSDLELINAMASDTDDQILKGKLKTCSQELALELAGRK
jgi:hypothetical protein